MGNPHFIMLHCTQISSVPPDVPIFLAILGRSHGREVLLRPKIAVTAENSHYGRKLLLRPL